MNWVIDQKFGWSRRLGWVALLIAAAIFLGWNIAHEKWLVLLVVGGLPFLALWPVPLALGAFVILVPFDVVAVVGQGEGGAALTFFAGGLAAAVLLVTGYLRRRLERPAASALWWSLFVAWGALSSLWAIDSNLAIGALPTVLGTLFLYLVASSVRISSEEFDWVVLAIVVGGCAAAAYSVSQHSSGIFYRASMEGRSSLIMGGKQTDPNVFAASLFLPLSLAVGSFLESRGWHRILYVAMGGLIAVAVVLTMSRGAMLGLAVMTFVYIRKLGFDRRVLIPIAIVMLAMIALPKTFLGRLQNAESSGGAGRIYIWEVGVAALKHYGFFGAGLHNFGEAYMQYVGEGSRIYSFNSADAHNDYLLIAVELGIVGIGFLGMAVTSAIRAGRRLQDRLNQQLAHSAIPYEAAALAMLTSCFFVGMLWRKAFWLIWMMYALLMRLPQEKDKTNPSSATRHAGTTVDALRVPLRGFARGDVSSKLY
jgi:O-antigen ligase